MDKLIITRLRGKICTALFSESGLMQLTLEEDGSKSLLGNIYIGRVQKVVAGINAAFVDLAPGITGYYSLEENRRHFFASEPQGLSVAEGKKPRQLKAGDEIVVQVSRDAVKTKASVLTSNLSFAGRYCVVTAGKRGMGFSSKLTDNRLKSELKEMWKERNADLSDSLDELGIIVRTNGAFVSPGQVMEEYGRLEAFFRRLRDNWGSRTCFSCLYRALPSYISSLRDSGFGRLGPIITDEPVFYEELKAYLTEFQKEDVGLLSLYEDSLLPLTKLYSLETALERALSKKVWLKSGGYLVIEPTEAMVVIDVNTGKYSGKKTLEDTIRRINMEAADEIGRQLRLRNLSGIIMVDFIDMERQEDREQLLEHLREVVRRDPVKTVVVEMTKLNLVEMTRKKVRRPLYEQAEGSGEESL